MLWKTIYSRSSLDWLKSHFIWILHFICQRHRLAGSGLRCHGTRSLVRMSSGEHCPALPTLFLEPCCPFIHRLYNGGFGLSPGSRWKDSLVNWQEAAHSSRTFRENKLEGKQAIIFLGSLCLSNSCPINHGDGSPRCLGRSEPETLAAVCQCP